MEWKMIGETDNYWVWIFYRNEGRPYHNVTRKQLNLPPQPPGPNDGGYFTLESILNAKGELSSYRPHMTDFPR